MFNVTELKKKSWVNMLYKTSPHLKLPLYKKNLLSSPEILLTQYLLEKILLIYSLKL